MRPLRFVLSLAACLGAFVLLIVVAPWRASEEHFEERSTTIGTYFHWQTPSSLFPPSAIISLTDDNSTFFLARPAAFGPLLPAKSLSGQLWIGSGFGDDRLGRNGPGAGAEGELGCSDIPDWNDGQYRSNTGTKMSAKDAKSTTADGAGGKRKRSVASDDDDEIEEDDSEDPTQDDGTDDHLHHPLPPSDGLKANGESAGKTRKPAHADIQSLQEGAEIAGKIVLLSRGGCGFLEKVKWVQRRGGVALIVGDDIRGGPLVTMYARGDVSNVTIPSLFTSHTTAHLLSSLIPSGGMWDDLSPEEAARLGYALGDKSESVVGGGENTRANKPNFATTSTTSKPTTISRTPKRTQRSATNEEDRASWFGAWFGRSRQYESGSRRPPSSGNVGWVLQEDFDEAVDEIKKQKAKKVTTSTSSAHKSAKTTSGGSGDGFVIGVQDWRDPDLVAEQKERQQATTSTLSSSLAPQATKKPAQTTFVGGSITPGSGEYGAKAANEALELGGIRKQISEEAKGREQSTDIQSQSTGWFGRFFASGKSSNAGTNAERVAHPSSAAASSSLKAEDSQPHLDTNGVLRHEGLWVTLTPTSMSTSPFFDTLLVLVVSPLVTLTVVYALLILRSRIRRRRWRAPKSVVERLPVRTYQTMPTPSATGSTTSSISSPVSDTTPLLPTAARPIKASARPRARTASEALIQASSSLQSDVMASPSPDQIEEKRASGLAEWRKRYGNKQRECVVCLEEYVDGVSRVMSLPCGHEFHAECITPWLTTRRRTCPICKGDVVRSLARANNGGNGAATGSSPLQQQYNDDEDETDVQEQAAVTRNDDPASQRPVSREDEAFEDLERGVGGVEGRTA